MWGSSFEDNVGRAVGFVTPQGEVSRFVTGLNRPLDVTMGPAGDLWVADFVPGIIYRVWYDGPAVTAPPPPVEASTTPTRLALPLAAVAVLLAVIAGLVLNRRRR